MSKESRSYTLDRCIGYIFYYHLKILFNFEDKVSYSKSLLFLVKFSFFEFITRETELTHILIETKAAASALIISTKPHILGVFYISICFLKLFFSDFLFNYL